MEKKCWKCEQTLDETGFNRNRRKPDGLATECKDCVKTASKAYYATHKHKWVERDIKLREKDPEAFKIKAKAAQDRYRASPTSTVKLRYLESRYGLSIDQFVAMENGQQNRCAMCGREASIKNRLHVDHDHKTGAVRDLLCFGHNTMLGDVGDSVAMLKMAIAYLIRHGAVDEALPIPLWEELGFPVVDVKKTLKLEIPLEKEEDRRASYDQVYLKKDSEYWKKRYDANSTEILAKLKVSRGIKKYGSLEAYELHLREVAALKEVRERVRLEQQESKGNGHNRFIGPIQLNHKWCKHCRQVQPNSNFYKREASGDGPAPVCIPCKSVIDRVRHQAKKL